MISRYISSQSRSHSIQREGRKRTLAFHFTPGIQELICQSCKEEDAISRGTPLTDMVQPAMTQSLSKHTISFSFCPAASLAGGHPSPQRSTCHSADLRGAPLPFPVPSRPAFTYLPHWKGPQRMMNQPSSGGLNTYNGSGLLAF